jgi:hypothetical protein
VTDASDGLTSPSSATLRLTQCGRTVSEHRKSETYLTKKLDSRVGCNELLGGPAFFTTLGVFDKLKEGHLAGF